MFSIDVQIDRYTDADSKARHYGIGQYRYIPGKRTGMNAVRAGIVKVKSVPYKEPKKPSKRRLKKQQILAKAAAHLV